jgi:rubrerythrin
MTKPSTVDEILDFAIEREEEAADFYSNLAGTAKQPAMREAFEQFAREERGHRAKLMNVKAGKRLLSSSQKIDDLKIADYAVAEKPTERISYRDALVLAMKREKAAFRLYSDLASRTEDAEIRDLLLGLAQEEAKHKLRFEIEYDDALTQN